MPWRWAWPGCPPWVHGALDKTIDWAVAASTPVEDSYNHQMLDDYRGLYIYIYIHIYIYIYLIYPRGSNSEHKPGAQNEHQPNAENKGLIWWYDTDKFLYQNQTMDQVDTMNM